MKNPKEVFEEVKALYAKRSTHCASLAACLAESDLEVMKSLSGQERDAYLKVAPSMWANVRLVMGGILQD